MYTIVELQKCLYSTRREITQILDIIKENIHIKSKNLVEKEFLILLSMLDCYVYYYKKLYPFFIKKEFIEKLLLKDPNIQKLKNESHKLDKSIYSIMMDINNYRQICYNHYDDKLKLEITEFADLIDGFKNNNSGESLTPIVNSISFIINKKLTYLDKLHKTISDIKKSPTPESLLTTLNEKKKSVHQILAEIRKIITSNLSLNDKEKKLELQNKFNHLFAEVYYYEMTEKKINNYDTEGIYPIFSLSGDKLKKISIQYRNNDNYKLLMNNIYSSNSGNFVESSLTTFENFITKKVNYNN